jgi:conjugal transfer pilin signal peptidase TrbI
MIVAFPVPEPVRDIVYGRQWLLKGALLMKPIAALPTESVSITDEGLYINDKLFGPVFFSDRQGMPLPRLRFSSTLTSDQVFVASPYERSFDSRYFGPLHMKDIVAQAIPVLTF